MIQTMTVDRTTPTLLLNIRERDEQEIKLHREIMYVHAVRLI